MNIIKQSNKKKTVVSKKRIYGKINLCEIKKQTSKQKEAKQMQKDGMELIFLGRERER